MDETYQKKAESLRGYVLNNGGNEKKVTLPAFVDAVRKKLEDLDEILPHNNEGRVAFTVEQEVNHVRIQVMKFLGIQTAGARRNLTQKMRSAKPQRSQSKKKGRNK